MSVANDPQIGGKVAGALEARLSDTLIVASTVAVGGVWLSVAGSFVTDSNAKLIGYATAESYLSVACFTRLGSRLSARLSASVGQALSMLGASSLGSALSVQSMARLSSTASVNGWTRLGEEFFAAGEVELGSVFSVQGRSRIGCDLSAWMRSVCIGQGQQRRENFGHRFCNIGQFCVGESLRSDRWNHKRSC